MKHTTITLATAALLLGSAAIADTPGTVINRIRQMVEGIDAQTRSASPNMTEVNLEGPDGINRLVSDQDAEVVSIKHWSPRSGGGRVKAVAQFGGEFVGTDAQYYWAVLPFSVQKPLFAFMTKTYRDARGNVKRTEKWRCYFENGKAKVFKVGDASLSKTDDRCKALVKSMDDVLTAITPGD